VKVTGAAGLLPSSRYIPLSGEIAIDVRSGRHITPPPTPAENPPPAELDDPPCAEPVVVDDPSVVPPEHALATATAVRKATAVKFRIWLQSGGP
jgi:hypothetical protein